MATPKTIKENDYTFMQDPYGGGGDSWGRSSGWRKRRVRRGRVSLTQYLESQEDQNMTRLLNFLELKRGEERWFLCHLEWRRRGVYIGGENMNWRPFNEGWQRIMNLDLILVLGEIWCIKWKDWWEWGASQVRFFRNYCNSL